MTLPEPFYQDESVTLYHGDALELLPLLTFIEVDHVITDPPYAKAIYDRMRTTPGNPNWRGGKNERYDYESARVISIGGIGACDDMIEPCAAAFTCARRWTIVYSDVESVHLWRGALTRNGLRYIRTGAWVKTNPQPQISGDRPATGFEPCTIAHAPGTRLRWNGGGHAAVWRYPHGSVGPQKIDHPCPKPLALMRLHVEQFTDAGETILDPFAGSGTTLRAAKDLGRRAIGIELIEEYCAVIAQRMAQQSLFAPLTPRFDKSKGRTATLSLDLDEEPG